MSDKLLKSITYPDIGKYVVADPTLAISGAAADSKATGDALATKAEVDGHYSDFTAGNAEQLVSNVKVNDKTPYIFRTSGGSVDIGDREYVDAIVGGTVAWNQFVKTKVVSDTTTSYAGITITNKANGTVVFDGTATATFWISNAAWNSLPYIGALTMNGHVVLIDFNFNDNGRIRQIGTSSLAYSCKNGASVIKPFSTSVSSTIQMQIVEGDTFNNVVISPQLFDLTQMFGSTIADYIYSLETANAGAGVAWFKKYFPKPYYAYNAGELMSVKALRHITRGFNAWDEEWESGYYSRDNGTKAGNSTTTYFRSKNFIPCLPSTTYYIKQPAVHASNSTFCGLLFYDADQNYISARTESTSRTFTTPSNAYYMTFYIEVGTSGATYQHDICINLHWDGERDGEYEEYVEHVYELDSDLELRGIPKLTAGNDLYYDGDVYEPDGTVTRKYGIVDLGTLGWVKYSSQSYDNLFYAAMPTMRPTSSAYEVANILCVNYKTTTQSLVGTSGHTNKYISGGAVNAGDARFWLNDEAYTEASAIKSALNGVMAVYELATPTTESADPYVGTQIVNDFGTEEYKFSNSVFPVPVGHDTDYPINLVAKLEMAPNSPEGDGTYVVKQTNGQNEYVPLIIPSEIPAVPTTDGTYKLTVTVTNGTPVLSWEA